MAHIFANDYGLAINYADNPHCPFGCCTATVKGLMSANSHGSLCGKFNWKTGEFDIRTASINPHEQFTLRGTVPASDLPDCPKCGRPKSEPHCGFGESWR